MIGLQKSPSVTNGFPAITPLFIISQPPPVRPKCPCRLCTRRSPRQNESTRIGAPATCSRRVPHPPTHWPYHEKMSKLSRWCGHPPLSPHATPPPSPLRIRPNRLESRVAPTRHPRCAPLHNLIRLAAVANCQKR